MTTSPSRLGNGVRIQGGHRRKRSIVLFVAGAFALVVGLAGVTERATADDAKITILYDAFGTDPAMKKDWGFAALVEIGGKRILFDTGNNPDIFAANVKAKGVDLSKLDYVILSHRHSDHMAGLAHVLTINPHVKISAP